MPKAGIICPERLYNTEALRQLGIGSVLLMKARGEGVEAILAGNINWYRGADLISWLENRLDTQEDVAIA